jgi:hypothetical protein
MPDVSIAPASLHRLRRRLERYGAGEGAAILHDAGFATGESLSAAWRNRVAERTGLGDPSALDTRWFGPLLDELCVTLGWGSLSVTPLGDTALLLESGDWAEADPHGGAAAGCHFTCGCLAAFLTAQAGSALGVLEVECRTAGHDACRFLAGAEATLGMVVDLLAAGGDWRMAFVAPDVSDIPPPAV